MLSRPVRLAFILYFAVAAISQAAALAVSADFSSTNQRDNSTLIWNAAQNRLHPPLRVSNYDDSGPLQNRNFDIGDGSDGAFVPSRYAIFSEGGNLGGLTITINTDTYPELQFTTFQLDPLWTIRPSGSLPLIIRVQGDALILGTIDCSGENGEDMNGIPSQDALGGTGHCGGGNGGDAIIGLPANSGDNGGPVVIGGGGLGPNGPTPGEGASLAQSGGGGGGAYASSRGLAYDATDGGGGGGGLHGEFCRDNDFDVEGGGFGGGAGGYDDTGAFTYAGGAGGAGGGYIFLAAGGAISISGSVLANGGNGGSTTGILAGGGGGGGGGGSIAMFAGSEVYLDPGSVVRADRGLGGSSPAGDGGDGTAGRTWLVGRGGYSVLVGGALPEYPDPLLVDVGLTRYQTGTFIAESLALDTLNTLPTLSSVSSTSNLPGLSTLLIEVATSSQSGFVASAWTDVSTAPFSLERFVRFRVTLDNQDAMNPAELSALTLNMEGFEQGKFDFKGACARVGTGGGASPGATLFLLVLPLLLACGFRCRLRVLGSL